MILGRELKLLMPEKEYVRSSIIQDTNLRSQAA